MQKDIKIRAIHTKRRGPATQKESRFWPKSIKIECPLKMTESLRPKSIKIKACGKKRIKIEVCGLLMQ